MGQQQLLLILLAILVIGVAIAAATGLFVDQEIMANKDAINHDIKRIAGNARAYYIRPPALRGGGYSYVGFQLPGNYRQPTNPNAIYAITVTATDLTISATSLMDPNNTTTVTLNSKGKLIDWTYTGDFQ